MRIVSQNGNVDFPYESIVVVHASDRVVIKHNEKDYIVAEYSSDKKAYKAVEMLRDQYMRLGCFSILASGTCQHMENSFSEKDFPEKVVEFCKMNIFWFPKDEDVEVEDE